jgi:hypothetical protein
MQFPELDQRFNTHLDILPSYEEPYSGSRTNRQTHPCQKQDLHSTRYLSCMHKPHKCKTPLHSCRTGKKGLGLTLPIASNPLSKKNNIPRNVKMKPKPVSPIPISATTPKVQVQHIQTNSEQPCIKARGVLRLSSSIAER